MRLSGLCLLVLALSLPLTGCDTTSDAPEPLTEARLSVTGLTQLPSGSFYEAWVVIRNLPTSLGKFNVNAAGGLTTTGGQSLTGGLLSTEFDLTPATLAFITVEPKGDTNDSPAASVLLAGAVNGTQAALSTAHPDAFGIDFADAGGSYILATYTSPDTGDERSGLWFADPSASPPAASLSLPTLPEGWRYEGWALLDEDTPLSTGPFTRPDFRDEATPFSLSTEGPSLPGEDFLQNAPFGLTFPIDLAGAGVLVTIEPDPDSDPDVPYALRLLTGDVPANATGRTSLPLTNVASGFPSGSISFN